VLLSWTVRRGDLPEYIVICEKGSVHLWMNRASMDFYPTETASFPATNVESSTPLAA